MEAKITKTAPAPAFENLSFRMYHRIKIMEGIMASKMNLFSGVDCEEKP